MTINNAINSQQLLSSSDSPSFGFPTVQGLTLNNPGSATILNLNNNSATNNQTISTLFFNGHDSSGFTIAYAGIKSVVVSNTNGATKGKIVFSPDESGSITDYMAVDGSTQSINLFKTLNISTLTASQVLLSDASKNVTSVAQLSLSNGGTNANLTASNGGIIYSTASAFAILSGTSTAGQALLSGASGAPSWSTPTYPSSSGSAGKILRSDGTNNVYSTSTFSDTYSASNLLYSNGANTVTGLATANNGVLITSSGGVPSISSTLPSAVQSNITALGALSALTATSIVVTDGSSNLATVTSATSYTPTIGDGTNNFTTSTANGKYFKTGHLYHVQAQLVWTSKGSASAGLSIQISLPATLGSNSIRACVTLGFTSGVSWTGSQVIGVSNSGQNFITLYGINSTGIAPTVVTVAQASASGEIQVNLFFWDN